MTRGVEHPAELRAQVIAAVLAGTTIAQAARQYGLAKRTVANWLDGTVGIGQRMRETEPDLGDLILSLIGDHIETLSAQLQAAARPEWVEKQSAADLAQLVGTERDTLLRLLGGLRPLHESDEPQLAAPATSAAEP